MKRCRRSCTHTFQTFLRFDNFFLACKKRFWSFAHAQISEYKYQISNSSVAGQFLTVPRLLSYFTGVTTRRSFNTSCGSGEKEHSCQAVKNERNNFRSNRQNIMAWKTCSKPPPWKVHPKSPCWKTPTLEKCTRKFAAQLPRKTRRKHRARCQPLRRRSRPRFRPHPLRRQPPDRARLPRRPLGARDGRVYNNDDY